MQNVFFENIQDYPALKMTWRNNLSDAEVTYSFDEINNALTNATEPMFVIIDLMANPTYPLLTTVHVALPVYKNELLREWLLIGNNWMARTIEGTLAKMTRRKNVRWFKNEAEVFAYLSKVAAEA